MVRLMFVSGFYLSYLCFGLELELFLVVFMVFMQFDDLYVTCSCLFVYG